jgi:hypothetical protein
MKRVSGKVLVEMLKTALGGDSQAYSVMRLFASAEVIFPTQPEIEQLIRADRATKRLDRSSSNAEVRQAANAYDMRVKDVRSLANKITPPPARSESRTPNASDPAQPRDAV